MPLYEYQCNVCGHRFEVIQKFSDPPPAACLKCGSAVTKLMSSPAIQFKGSGFYLTDYGRGGKSDADAKDGKPDGASSGGDSKAAEGGSKSAEGGSKPDGGSKSSEGSAKSSGDGSKSSDSGSKSSDSRSKSSDGGSSTKRDSGGSGSPPKPSSPAKSD